MRFPILAAIVSLLYQTPHVRADLALPPTFVMDALHFGYPASIIVGVSLVLATIASFFWLMRRGLGRWRSLTLCMFSYAAVNMCFWMYGMNASARRRAEYRDEWRQRFEAEATNPATTSPSDRSPDTKRTSERTLP